MSGATAWASTEPIVLLDILHGFAPARPSMSPTAPTDLEPPSVVQYA